MNSYTLTGDDEDLRRLKGMSELLDPYLRAGLSRVGAQPGWTMLDAGCGPGGALPVLAQMAGPSGRVVGIDRQTDALATAGRAVRALSLTNVSLFEGDVANLCLADVGGPFDLVLTRMLLMHQTDPDRTLTALRGLLRPGGILLCQEITAAPAPWSRPALPALDEYWSLFSQLLAKSGVPGELAESLPARGRAAGFDLMHTGGFFIVAEPALVSLHVATLLAARPRLLATGVATGEQVERLVSELNTMADGGYEWVTSGTFIETALRSPV